MYKWSESKQTATTNYDALAWYSTCGLAYRCVTNVYVQINMHVHPPPPCVFAEALKKKNRPKCDIAARYQAPLKVAALATLINTHCQREAPVIKQQHTQILHQCSNNIAAGCRDLCCYYQDARCNKSKWEENPGAATHHAEMRGCVSQVEPPDRRLTVSNCFNMQRVGFKGGYLLHMLSAVCVCVQPLISEMSPWAEQVRNGLKHTCRNSLTHTPVHIPCDM